MSGRGIVGSWKHVRVAEDCSRLVYWRRRVVVLVTEVEKGFRSNAVADLRKKAQVEKGSEEPIFSGQ